MTERYGYCKGPFRIQSRDVSTLDALVLKEAKADFKLNHDYVAFARKLTECVEDATWTLGGLWVAAMTGPSLDLSTGIVHRNRMLWLLNARCRIPITRA